MELRIFSETFELVPGKIGPYPFSTEEVPVRLKTEMVRIPWKEKDGICSPVPDSMIPQGKPETVYLQPYGCTNLRMTEMPLAGQASDYNDFGENSR